MLFGLSKLYKRVVVDFADLLTLIYILVQIKYIDEGLLLLIYFILEQFQCFEAFEHSKKSLV